MTLGLRQVALTTLLVSSLSVGMAHAASVQLDGQFLSATVDDSGLPAGFGQVSLNESAPVWDCSNGACSLAAPLQTELIFAPTTGAPVTVTSQALIFRFDTLTKSQVVLDPLGHEWTLSADAGKWLIGVNVASQVPQAGDPQFATAYGQFKYSSDFDFLIPTWRDGFPIINDGSLWDGAAGQSAILGLKQTGEVGAGPGALGIGLAPAGVEWSWWFWTQLDGANYAYPSTTDVHCAALSCMNFMTANVNVNNYFFSFAVTATPSAVPEVGTLPLMALGLVGGALVVRRRRR
ncbi:MAG: PEP-CTERM sorting domain-containing protein [Aquabacterium sp.]|uniref:PEP-CTERM sorting domain-containing protein n=1 Tax=Aquabacterium sp. TaxID=1872578 RepID=UPI0025B96161|nr:PEP-CTERM sorting domain-containing protein [Aquabacterium sp.]MBI5926761.1 PEP-CTERM sorting domain-containing protein [Aquabacterium sp.]